VKRDRVQSQIGKHRFLSLPQLARFILDEHLLDVNELDGKSADCLILQKRHLIILEFAWPTNFSVCSGIGINF
jgi:hypothetical protein